MITDTVGVVLGRFQLHELHGGHIALLDYVSNNYKRMLILVGVRPAEQSDTNPLNFETRRVMLSEAYPDATILPVVDCRSDKVWSKNVDSIIQTAYTYGCKAKFHVGRNSFESHYDGKYPIHIHDFGMTDDLDDSATNIRNSLKDEILNTPAARLGAINAIMNLPHRQTIMVDMVMWRRGKGYSYEILVGRKEGEQEWRLPGGHVDAGENFRQAASREMREETGMVLTDGAKGWEFVGDFEVPDWRVRDTDRITYRTVLMLGEYSMGSARGNDDLPEVKWVWASTLRHGLSTIVEEHRHLFEAVMKVIERKLQDA